MVTKDDISQDMVDAVEVGQYGCGMGCCAWDTIDPREIIAAAINTYANRYGEPNDNIRGSDCLQRCFNPQDASYLVVPRSMLQSMPDHWQGSLAVLLHEMDDECRARGIQWPAGKCSVHVETLDEFFEVEPDDLANYENGRRLWEGPQPAP